MGGNVIFKSENAFLTLCRCVLGGWRRRSAKNHTPPRKSFSPNHGHFSGHSPPPPCILLGWDFCIVLGCAFFFLDHTARLPLRSVLAQPPVPQRWPSPGPLPGAAPACPRQPRRPLLLPRGGRRGRRGGGGGLARRPVCDAGAGARGARHVRGRLPAARCAHRPASHSGRKERLAEAVAIPHLPHSSQSVSRA